MAKPNQFQLVSLMSKYVILETIKITISNISLQFVQSKIAREISFKGKNTKKYVNKFFRICNFLYWMPTNLLELIYLFVDSLCFLLLYIDGC